MLRLFCVFFFWSSLAFSQTANFKADVTSGCAPLTVHFEDLSTGGITSWNWDLGKTPATTSSLQNPSIIYNEPGTYTIKLTVNGSVSETKAAYITVHANPTVSFTFAPQGSCSPLPVVFTDQSTAGSGTIASWSWVFGDGETSVLPTPTHTYSNAGEYTSTLTVKNSAGCSASKVSDVPVKVEGVAALFSTSTISFCTAPADVEFHNESIGDGTLNYAWDFGDGKTSTDKNPTHRFTNAGEYTVRLATKNGAQCSGEFSKKIRVGAEGGIDFSLDKLRVCIGQPVNLTETSTKVVLEREWNFGNGLSSSAFNPSVSYQQGGTFSIQLQAKLEGSDCAAIVTKKVEVVANAVPDFSFAVACAGKATFTNKSSLGVTYGWNFGDGTVSTETSPVHSFVAAGEFTVSLTAFNELQCGAITTKTLTIQGDPVAELSPNERQSCTEASLSGCVPFTLNLENKTNYGLPFTTRWDFSDGTRSESLNVSKTYSTKGVFDVLLTVTNAAGCKDTARVKVHVADKPPTPKFTFSRTTVCTDEMVDFKDTSEGANFSCWDFGDGSGSTSKDVSHQYIIPGTYSVTLTSKNDGCAAKEIKTNLITVLDPEVKFEVRKNCDDPYAVEVVNQSRNFTSFQFDFGDGTQSNANQVTHRYDELGNYKIGIVVENSTNGCSITQQQDVQIQDLEANFDVSLPQACRGEPVQFLDKSKFAVAWNWTFSDGSGSLLASPEKTYNAAGSYGATLQVTDSDGCIETISKPNAVRVINIDGDFSLVSRSTCDRLAVEFSDKSTGFPAITEWNWNFGDGGAGTGRNPTHKYQKLGTYTVTLELKNPDGQCSIQRTGVVEFTNPIPDFKSLVSEVCAGESITFINLSSNASQFMWKLGDGSTSMASLPVHTYTQSGYYTVELTARDSYGCEKAITKTDFIRIRKPVAAFEAFQTSAECPPLVTAFVNRSSADVVRWNWEFGDGQRSTIASPSNTYRVPGVYDVALEVIDALGCKDVVQQKAIVKVGGPFGEFSYTGVFCPNDTISFSANTTNAVVHRWDFADGTVTEGGTQMKHVYEKPGEYVPVLLLIDGNGCKVSVSNPSRMRIWSRPDLAFTFEPAYPFVGEEVRLIGTSNEDVSLVWKWQEQNANGDTLDVVFDEPGAFDMVLSASNAARCIAETSATLLVQKDVAFLPNVVTDNGDTKNDTFKIPDIEGGSWAIEIYNRWGNVVHSNPEYHNEWSAAGLSSGVYYYVLTNNYRREKVVKGFVHVMR